MSTNALAPHATLLPNATFNASISGDELNMDDGGSLIPPSSGETVVAVLIRTITFALISRQMYACLSSGGKGPAFQNAFSLWLLSAMRWFCDFAILYALREFSTAQPLEPGQKPSTAIGAILSQEIVAAIVYLCISVILSRQLTTLTGRRLYTFFVILAVWVQAVFLRVPGLATSSLLTHILVVTQIGIEGTARALIQPQNESSSECPRLRLLSSLSKFAPSPHASPSRKYFVAVATCAVNLLLLYFLCKAGDMILGLYPENIALPSFLRFSDVYTLLYLHIKNKGLSKARSGSSTDLERESTDSG
ncbi:unnamed protein product [Peniophora sp. CBMAI 1063]|nr:unnamed protein product [Peniophora sp. CBMAI 1063]